MKNNFCKTRYIIGGIILLLLIVSFVSCFAVMSSKNSTTGDKDIDIHINKSTLTPKTTKSLYPIKTPTSTVKPNITKTPYPTLTMPQLTLKPTLKPTIKPTVKPTIKLPTKLPTIKPTVKPTIKIVKPTIKLKKVSRSGRNIEVMGDGVYQTLSYYGDKYNLPTSIWYPIAMTESSGNPKTTYRTSKEYSVGIFQVNTYAHHDVSPSKLKNTAYNANYQMPKLYYAYVAGKNRGLSGISLLYYTAKNGQRPCWNTRYKQSLLKHYKYLLSL